MARWDGSGGGERAERSWVLNVDCDWVPLGRREATPAMH